MAFLLQLPPSTNKLYQSRGGGKLALTEEAKRYREHVKSTVVETMASVMEFPTSKEDVYVFDVFLYFEKLENPGWFQRWTKDVYYTRGKKKGQLKGHKGDRMAKTRYKKLDYDNRIKFLQDCVAKSVGIPDDCQIFGGLHEKHEDPKNPRAEVTMRLSDWDKYFHGGEHGQR